MKQSYYYTLLVHNIKTSPIGDSFTKQDIENTIATYLTMITLNRDEFEALFYLLKDTTKLHTRNNIGYIVSEYSLSMKFQKVFSSILISLLLHKKNKHDFDNVSIALIEVLRSSTENNIDQQISQFKTAMRACSSYEVTRRLSPKNSARFFVTPSLTNRTTSIIQSYDAAVAKLADLNISSEAFNNLDILVTELNHRLGVFAPISKYIVVSPQKKGEHRVTLFHEAIHRLIHNHPSPELRNKILNLAKDYIELAEETQILSHSYWITIIDNRYSKDKIGEETLVRLIQADAWEHDKLNKYFKHLPAKLKHIIAGLFNLAQILVSTANIKTDKKPSLTIWNKQTIREQPAMIDNIAEANRVGSICRQAIRGLTH